MKYTDGYKSLNVYKKADELVFAIYTVTKEFPRSELFGLISQIRRASVSIVANLVEGWARKTKPDKTRMYYISRGSLTEVEYYIDLSRRLEYIDENKYILLENLRTDVARLLNGLINSMEK